MKSETATTTTETTPKKPRAKPGSGMLYQRGETWWDQVPPGRTPVLREHRDEGRTPGAQDPPRSSDARRDRRPGTAEPRPRDL